jgi:hypothetical protein
MSIYYPTCADTITDPVCTDCPEVERGRVRAIGFKKSTFSFSDPTDASEWDNAIADKNCYIFPAVHGTFTQTEVEGTGFGDQDTTLDGYENVLEVYEPNYNDNYGFWNTIKNSREWEAIYVTETKMHIADEVCVVIPKQPVEDDLNSRVVWHIMIKWKQEDMLQPQAKPGNVFDTCIAPS